jgi:hypothetical protein
MGDASRLVYRDTSTGLCLFGVSNETEAGREIISYRLETFPARPLPEHLKPADPFDRRGMDAAFQRTNAYLRAKR